MFRISGRIYTKNVSISLFQIEQRRGTTGVLREFAVPLIDCVLLNQQSAQRRGNNSVVVGLSVSLNAKCFCFTLGFCNLNLCICFGFLYLILGFQRILDCFILALIASCKDFGGMIFEVNSSTINPSWFSDFSSLFRTSASNSPRLAIR